MPKPGEHFKDLPAFYKHQTWHGVLFGWTKCYKLLYPSTTTKEVVGAFMKEFNIQDGEMDLLVAVDAYNRINKHHLQSLKS